MCFFNRHHKFWIKYFESCGWQIERFESQKECLSHKNSGLSHMVDIFLLFHVLDVLRILHVLPTYSNSPIRDGRINPQFVGPWIVNTKSPLEQICMLQKDFW